MLQTSKGVLIITNKRLLLNPLPGNRPLSIPLDQVLTYQGYQNGIEIYKEDTKRGFFFEIDSIGSVEIFGICLSFLLLGYHRKFPGPRFDKTFTGGYSHLPSAFGAEYPYFLNLFLIILG